jgi:hypothetical protein
MLASALRPLMSTLRSSAPRRVMAVVCAVALLAVGFAHSIDNFHAPMPIVAMQADLGSFDGFPDTSKTAPGPIEHCHGCSTIALPVLAQPIGPIPMVAKLPAPRLDSVRSHSPLAETPPPIFTI